MSLLSELAEQIAICPKCAISKTRKKAVPGVGAENAEIMFIGEAPGFNEDQQGLPFVGQAGHVLDHLLESIKLERSKVFITNIIKCRPPDNREPLPYEIENCRPWLDRQIELIHPRMIVTLGRYSMEKFFPGKSISKIHGTAQKLGDVIYFAMYHPAAALHQSKLRQALEADMFKIPGFLVKPADVKKEKKEPQQLNLFGV
jgi:uracil-DNA glycosylase family 4